MGIAQEKIIIKGLRQNNLKNISLEIPKEKIIELIVALIEVVVCSGIGIFITYALIGAINNIF